MKSHDVAPAVIAGIGFLSVAAVTAAFLDLYPTYESLAAVDPISPSSDSTVIPIEQPVRMTLASIHQTIDETQEALYNQAQGMHVDMTCFRTHMQVIDVLQAEIARTEASMLTMNDAQKTRAVAYIQMNIDRIENEFDAIRGLFPAPPHGMPRHYCT